MDYYPNSQGASAESNAISVYLHLRNHTQHFLEARYKFRFSLLYQARNTVHELLAKTVSFTGVPEVNDHYSLRGDAVLGQGRSFRNCTLSVNLFFVVYYIQTEKPRCRGSHGDPVLQSRRGRGRGLA
ncbi:hypothetical protein D1007_10356 [Hordeum vulgare]|nr:hypothetical protein D1007_10356 [Hordeum vulgare]